MAKKFYIFQQIPNGDSETGSSLELRETYVGTVIEARERIGSDAYKDATYLVLEDTSGAIVKGTQTIVKKSIVFDPPRKHAKKAKPESVAVEETPLEEKPTQHRRGARS